MSYHDLVRFEALCLEDSWILAIHEAPELVAFAMEFSLLATHPLYTPPPPGEAPGYIRATSFSKRFRHSPGQIEGLRLHVGQMTRRTGGRSMHLM